jgi:hypothetical protein
MLNRMQGLILGFFALAWLGLVLLLLGMPEILDNHASPDHRGSPSGPRWCSSS